MDGGRYSSVWPPIIALKCFAMVLSSIMSGMSKKSPRQSKLRKVVLFKVKGHTGIRMQTCISTFSLDQRIKKVNYMKSYDVSFLRYRAKMSIRLKHGKLVIR